MIYINKSTNKCMYSFSWEKAHSFIHNKRYSSNIFYNQLKNKLIILKSLNTLNKMEEYVHVNLSINYIDLINVLNKNN